MEHKWFAIMVVGVFLSMGACEAISVFARNHQTPLIQINSGAGAGPQCRSSE